MFDAQPLPQYFSTEHRDLRASVRDFVAREFTPPVNAWDEEETFPRELHRKFSELGGLGIGYEVLQGGTPTDVLFHLIAFEELARTGCGGLQASPLPHTIGLPPVAEHGSAA